MSMNSIKRHKELLDVIKQEFKEFGEIHRRYLENRIIYEAHYIDEQHHTLFVLKYL